MSRTSRVNVDVAVRTEEMDRGITAAREKLVGFSKDLGRMKEQGEKFAQVGRSLVGGLAGVAILESPFRLISGYIAEMAQASDDAAKAIDNFRNSGQSLNSQGFTPVGAAVLASRRDEFKALAAKGFGRSFAEASAGQEFDTVSNFQKGLQYLGGFLGQRASDIYSGRGFMHPLDATKSSHSAGLEASSGSDTEALYWHATRATYDQNAKKTYELWRSQLGVGP